ncbi:TetR/AcrR family transcriptional regulator [Gordonia aichiensis]|uniref:Putative TetR family transcriptional regulator n=1 Tax=Gordonia aichiensis NBRC 108223 TaxID=1220583 RepID=L7KJP2_9ACTN|nr:putative TetR family transcriptional regulator [Gordonia aichiensis NBRC 108223]
MGTDRIPSPIRFNWGVNGPLARMSVDDRRTALVESAYRVIADHGVEGATTRRICAHAGMPLASFHYAFESRTALLWAVMEKAVPEDVSLMLESLLPIGGSSSAVGVEAMRTKMFEQLDAFYMLLKADPGRLQATISLGIYAHNHPELQPAGKQMYEHLYGLAAQGLAAAGEQAQITWLTPVEQIAPVFIANIIAITLVYLSTADDSALGAIAESLVRDVMTHVASR